MIPIEIWLLGFRAFGRKSIRATVDRSSRDTAASSPTGHCQSDACFRRGAAVSKLSGETRPGQRPKCPRTIVRETPNDELGRGGHTYLRAVTLAVYASMSRCRGLVDRRWVQSRSAANTSAADGRSEMAHPMIARENASPRCGDRLPSRRTVRASGSPARRYVRWHANVAATRARRQGSGAGFDRAGDSDCRSVAEPVAIQ